MTQPEEWRPAAEREVREQRSRPRPGGAIAALVELPFEGRRLTDFEVVGIVHLGIAGGVDTTQAVIGNMLAYLGRHPEERQRLVAEPELLPSAIEEFLRWDGPTMLMVRLCTEDVEIGGVTLRAGDRVFLHQTAANRDPAQFADPDRVDPTRPNLQSHLAFGYGTHYCLGAPLARLEAAIAFERIVRGYPDLEVGGGALEWRRTMLARNLDRLPVGFGSRAAA